MLNFSTTITDQVTYNGNMIKYTISYTALIRDILVYFVFRNIVDTLLVLLTSITTDDYIHGAPPVFPTPIPWSNSSETERKRLRRRRRLVADKLYRRIEWTRKRSSCVVVCSVNPVYRRA